MEFIDMTGWWKKYSAIALTIIAALNAAWVASPDLHEVLGQQAMAVANSVLAALGFVGRFIKQTRSE